MKAFAVLTIIFDDDTGATHDLSRIALSVDLAQSRPSAQNLGVTDFDEVDLVLATKGRDQLDVLGLRACLHENAEMGLALVQRLGTFTETPSKTVMAQRDLENLLRETSVNTTIKTTKDMHNQLEEHPPPTFCPWEPPW